MLQVDAGSIEIPEGIQEVSVMMHFTYTYEYDHKVVVITLGSIESTSSRHWFISLCNPLESLTHIRVLSWKQEKTSLRTGRMTMNLNHPTGNLIVVV